MILQYQSIWLLVVWIFERSLLSACCSDYLRYGTSNSWQFHDTDAVCSGVRRTYQTLFVIIFPNKRACITVTICLCCAHSSSCSYFLYTYTQIVHIGNKYWIQNRFQISHLDKNSKDLNQGCEQLRQSVFPLVCVDISSLKFIWMLYWSVVESLII